MTKTLGTVAALLLLGINPPAAQVPFEQVAADLSSADAAVRLRAARQLKEAAYPEAAVPLARLVTDPVDEVQLEAIAAELNIFLAEKIVPRRRVGLVIEVRNNIAADRAFSQGPLALGPRPVPDEVLTALAGRRPRHDPAGCASRRSMPSARLRSSRAAPDAASCCGRSARI